jgi:NAD(P)H dehydrogenase (quinone)
LLDEGRDITWHDLYEEGFDPLLPVEEIPASGKVHPEIEAHCQALSSADGILIVHLNWWGQPPAILKGWLDRVFRPGVAYRFEEGDAGEGIPIGRLKALAAVVISTSNTPADRESRPRSAIRWTRSGGGVSSIFAALPIFIAGRFAWW